MEDIKMEHELKLDRLAQLLDMRAARVRKLEGIKGTETYLFAEHWALFILGSIFDQCNTHLLIIILVLNPAPHPSSLSCTIEETSL